MTTAATTNTTTPVEGVAVPAAAAAAAPEDATGYTQMSSAFDELIAPSATPTKTPDNVTSPLALDAAAQATKDASAAAAGKVEGTGTTAPAAATGTTEVAATGSTEAVATGTTDEATAAANTAATDWKAEYDKLLAAQRAAPAPAEPEPTKPAETAPAAATPASLYTPDEQAVIAAYQTDWPGVSQGERLIRRAEYSQLVAHIFNEVKRVYDPLVQRALDTADTFESTTMVGEIRKAHADYNDAMHDEVAVWAGTLKGMRRAVAEKIIEEGDPQEVVDLITEFKQATGKTVTPPVGNTVATPTKPAAGSNVTDISEAAKKAAKAMGVVEGKRTATSTTDDPNDFDGTWEKLMADVK